MWTFAFSETEATEMVVSTISCGKRAWDLLKKVDDLSGTRFGATLQTPILIIVLASELGAAARRSGMGQFAVEVRVRRIGELSALEWGERGVWRKPSFGSRLKGWDYTPIVGETESESAGVKMLEEPRK